MSEVSQRKTILVIDDESIIRQSLCDQLEDIGFRVIEAENGKQGLDLIEKEAPDLVLTDLRMPEMSGLEVIEKSKQKHPNLLIIVISGAGHIGDAVEAMRLGAYDYLVKPVKGLDVLKHTVTKALDKAQEIEAQQNTELKLKEQVRIQTRELEKEFLDSVINGVADPLFVKDEEHRWIVLNDAFCQMLGKRRDELLGKSDYDFFPKEQADTYWSRDALVLKSTDVEVNEEELSSDGATKQVSISKSSFLNPTTGNRNLVGTIRDITEQKLAEQTLRRSQKMDAIGQLTGGIAHDFNNILGIILGNVSLLHPLISDNKNAQKRVAAIEKSAQRAADLTKQLLGFSRQQAAQVVTTDINKLIEDMRTLVARSATPEVTIEYHYSDDLWLTELDPGDFEDALMNLLINARDAMVGGGKIVVETNNIKLDAAYCNQTDDLTPGDYIQLIVSDTGEGISAEDQERIFEPFFSTKPRGKGTGLGLAMVFGFVKRTKGHINLYSEQGAGTTFRLYLPRDDGVEDLHRQKSSDQETDLPWGNETILVVDDELELLELAKELLTALGYNVLSARSGKEAMDHLSQREDISLLFTDVVMPGGMSGYELAELATVSNTRLNVLLTSGYTDKSIPHSGMERFKGQLISKPYNQAELAHRIRSVLGHSSVSGEVGDAEELDEARKEKVFAEWSDELNIGIEFIDDEHKNLLKLLNNCQQVAMRDDGDLATSLEKLNEYTAHHFKREEQIMELCGYPGLANHRQVHRLLLKQFAEKRQHYQKGILSEAALLVFLNSWLLDHIKTMDRAYVPYCDGAEEYIKQGLVEPALEVNDAGEII
jgi:hemerythrin-like metal-binding protein/PAS domain S-box-containing protein